MPLKQSAGDASIMYTNVLSAKGIIVYLLCFISIMVLTFQIVNDLLT